MKRWQAWTAATVLLVLALYLATPAEARVAAWKDLAQTITGAWTFAAGLTAHSYTDDNATAGEQHAFTGSGATGITGAGTFPLASYSVDWTMANPTTGPTGIDNGGIGSCATGVHRAYVSWLNQSGETGLSPASADVDIVGGPDFMLITRPTPPAGATHWRAWWSSFADGHAAKKSCSTNSVGAGISVIATTTFNCGCASSGIAEVSNSTGVVDMVRFLDGEARFMQIGATGSGTPWGTSGFAPLVKDVNRLYTDGTWMQISSDAGATKGHIAVEADNTLLVCPSGCEYSSVSAAAACIQAGTGTCSTPSSSNRYTVRMAAGTYAGNSIYPQPWTTFIGAGRHATTVTSSTSAMDLACTSCGNVAYYDATWQGDVKLASDTPQELIFAGNRVEGPATNDPAILLRTYGTSVAGSLRFENDQVVSHGQAAFHREDQNSGPLPTLFLRGNDFTADGTSAVADSAGFDIGQLVNVVSVGDTYNVSAPSTSMTAHGVRIRFHASVNATRVFFYDTRIRVAITHASSTSDAYGIRIENVGTPAAGTQIVFVNPTIEVSSAGSSGTVKGISIEHASSNLSVIVIGGTVTTSGGASAVDVAYNARLFTSGLQYSTSSGTEQPVATRVGSFKTQLLGRVGDLVAGTCTNNEIALDTGGANKEICICDGGAWACSTVTTATGPTN